MIPKKTFFLISTLFVLYTSIFAQQTDFVQQTDNGDLDNQITIKVTDSTSVSTYKIKDSLAASIDSITTIQKSDSISYPPQFRDFRRLGYNSAMFFGATVVAFGVLWVMPESVTNWDKEEMKDKGIFWKWKENVKAGPVWDKDNWVLNWITHPYCGGIYYMTARSSGFTIIESFGYSAIMSTFFWEYGVEAFAEIPSIQDLIITPVIGSVMGEGFFYIKKSILRHDKKVLNSKFLGISSLFLIDPFNTILDGFGYKEKVKTQMNIAPVGFDSFSNKTIWGVNFSASF